ncbi:MAG TPA: hypothetical protein VMV52_10965 [Candidatus Nanopelagicaceae bacterium]|nr:hypothetical protein [Candidatus Nanopelagicaceae bacterium]
MNRLREPTLATPTPGLLTAADRAWIASLLDEKPNESVRMVIHDRLGVQPFFHSECDYSWEI